MGGDKKQVKAQFKTMKRLKNEKKDSQEIDDHLYKKLLGRPRSR